LRCHDHSPVLAQLAAVEISPLPRPISDGRMLDVEAEVAEHYSYSFELMLSRPPLISPLPRPISDGRMLNVEAEVAEHYSYNFELMLSRPPLLSTPYI
jgi:hypothetical protein